MIFVPILKTKSEELSVIKSMNKCLSENFIPLFEILNDKFETRYRVDPITKEFVYEQGNKVKKRIKEEHTDDDVITLNYINELINGKRAFIDYFRFTIEKYGKNVDINKTMLAWKLSNNESMYKQYINEISVFNNLIPVVSIKSGFDMRKSDLHDLLLQLQSDNDSVALRITEEWLETYDLIVKNVLRETDFLLFDIGEQNPRSKIMELEEVMECGTKAKVILLNSPRKADKNNTEYENREITNLIDNCAREEYKNYNFKGFGDYCGLKDNLPLTNKSNGTGAALALLYDFNDNGFYSYVNIDTSQGMAGYYKIIPIILKDKAVLDPDNTCPAISKIEELNSSGNWRTWHNINMTRYMNQLYTNL